jgi:hypothetical protein
MSTQLATAKHFLGATWNINPGMLCKAPSNAHLWAHTLGYVAWGERVDCCILTFMTICVGGLQKYVADKTSLHLSL